LPVSVGDVENEDEADDVTIEGGRQAAVPFLSGRVPDLKIQGLMYSGNRRLITFHDLHLRRQKKVSKTKYIADAVNVWRQIQTL